MRGDGRREFEGNVEDGEEDENEEKVEMVSLMGSFDGIMNLGENVALAPSPLCLLDGWRACYVFLGIVLLGGELV